MHTCLGGDTSMADTLVGSEDLHSCADTLNDQMYESDNEMFEEMLPRDRNSKTFDWGAGLLIEKVLYSDPNVNSPPE